MNIKIVVATHKKYGMPTDPMYLPLHVGCEGKESIGFQGDNTGEHISYKNSSYNELTAIYWAWKNLQADYIGLVHYRRHFASRHRNSKDPFSQIVRQSEVEKMLTRYDVILPEKRRYYIETISSHFLHLPYIIPADLDCLCQVMEELQPEYVPSLKLMLGRTWAHMFNMFIMKQELFHQYCEWMFPIMEEVENRIDMSGRKPIEARFYISEFLMDTWIEKNQIPYGEMKVLFLERENLFKKGWIVFKRKLGLNSMERKQYANR